MLTGNRLHASVSCLKINELTVAWERDEVRGKGGAPELPHFSQLISQNFCRTTFVPVPAGASRRTYPHSHCYLFPALFLLLLPFLFFLLTSSLPLCVSAFFPCKANIICAKFSLQSLLIVYVRCFIKNKN